MQLKTLSHSGLGLAPKRLYDCGVKAVRLRRKGDAVAPQRQRHSTAKATALR